MKYDPQQRPTASQALQYPYFQVNAAMAPPPSLAEPNVPTYTRRPPGQSEHEERIAQVAKEKAVSLSHLPNFGALISADASEFG